MYWYWLNHHIGYLLQLLWFVAWRSEKSHDEFWKKLGGWSHKGTKKLCLVSPLSWGWQPLANDLFMAYITSIGVTIAILNGRESSFSKSRQNTGNFTVASWSVFFFFSGATTRVMMIFGNCEPGLRWLAITIPANTRASNSWLNQQVDVKDIQLTLKQ